VVPFAELGLGVGVFSSTLLGGDRQLGGSVELAEVLRVGVRFGGRRQWEFGVSGQHFSNGGLGHPNEGITYAGVSMAWHFP
jgi:hypothetical protein